MGAAQTWGAEALCRYGYGRDRAQARRAQSGSSPPRPSRHTPYTRTHTRTCARREPEAALFASHTLWARQPPQSPHHDLIYIYHRGYYSVFVLFQEDQGIQTAIRPYITHFIFAPCSVFPPLLRGSRNPTAIHGRILMLINWVAAHRRHAQECVPPAAPDDRRRPAREPAREKIKYTQY